MSVLDRIMEKKREAVSAQKRGLPERELRQRASRAPNPRPFLGSVRVEGELSVIAEMKKASPSAGLLRPDYRPADLARSYAGAGARALSVLTESDFFQGSGDHVAEALSAAPLPVLRKDFLFDPYQIYESRALGASCVLLIVAILDRVLYRDLLQLAAEQGLDALVEVHDESELDSALRENPGIVGINNRDLKDLSVDLETSFRLLSRVPKGACAVSESGIRSAQEVRRLRAAGAQAALIGESLLRGPDPAGALAAFVQAGKN